MRLWHIDLLEVLPRQQLLSQWRECCCIARNIYVNGTPNHLLVNKILDYDISDFYSYSILVSNEILRRGYKVDRSKFEKYYKCDRFTNRPFQGWHNDRYFLQCFYNLQEKYDCGGITEQEWCKVVNKYYERSCQNHGHLDR